MSTTKQQLHRALAALLAAILLFVGGANAQVWQLDSEQSSLTYLSSKLVAGSFSAIFEPNRFTRFSGSISPQAEAKITVDMTSVQTGIPIRDERVMEHAFAVKKYPQAVITMSLPKISEALSGVHQIKAKLSMRGQQKDIVANVRIDQSLTKAGAKVLVAQSVMPVLIDAKDYGMLEGFGTLRELAQLFNIPTTIPVSFSFVFVAK